MQYFERARLEYHPENMAPYDVLLGQVGRLTHPVEPPVRRIECSSNFRCLYFTETGHNLRGFFLEYWEAYGGLEQFGHPISEADSVERIEDGKSYFVQYFERARMELPYGQTPLSVADVTLGQLGRKLLQTR